MQKSGLLKNKLAIGITIAAITAIAGAAGVAQAAPDGKPNREQCEADGFKNYGQCVSEWAHKHGGGGYGGNNGVIVKPIININGNNNAVSVIIRIIFG